MTEGEIRAIISELNRIEVHGEENLDILVGIIRFLRMKLKEFHKPMVDEKVDLGTVQVKEFLDKNPMDGGKNDG